MAYYLPIKKDEKKIWGKLFLILKSSSFNKKTKPDGFESNRKLEMTDMLPGFGVQRQVDLCELEASHSYATRSWFLKHKDSKKKKRTIHFLRYYKDLITSGD